MSCTNADTHTIQGQFPSGANSQGHSEQVKTLTTKAMQQIGPISKSIYFLKVCFFSRDTLYNISRILPFGRRATYSVTLHLINHVCYVACNDFISLKDYKTRF